MIRTVKKRANGTQRIMQRTEGKSMTEQSHRKETNINTIIRKANTDGFLLNRQDTPTYGDFSGVSDFTEAHNRIKNAERDFMSLPSNIRNRFKNEPANLLEFIHDPRNEAEAIKLGLLPGAPETETPPSEATGTPSSDPETPAATPLEPAAGEQ